MGVITFEEYNKKRQQNSQMKKDNTISFSDYQTKYGINNTSTEVKKTGNSYLLPQMQTTSKDDEYIDTGKKYGDYWYQEYSTRKDDKIYSKNGKFYILNSRTGEYDNVDRIHYMTDATTDAQQLASAQAQGYKGNKTDLTKISNKILLDTEDLSKKEYVEYAKDLKRQEEKLNKEHQQKTKTRYSGTGIYALKQIGTKASDVGDTVDKEIIVPIKSFKDNYQIGKQNNELSLEYYKKMQGKSNKVEELENKINTYNKFNQDLINNPGATGSAIQNLNTQVESLKNQTLASGILGTVGGIGGFAIGGPQGAVVGAKAGASLGYTFGGTPYTYKLEAGNQYKTLIDMGVPKNIAKDAAQKTGAINAAIESGENILDVVTLGQAGKITSKATQEIYDKLVKAYGEKSLKTLLIQVGTSYGQNILSESMEEMAQEGTSIKYEKVALQKAGIERKTTREEDIDRILEAGKSAAISTAFTAPITSIGGSIATNVIKSIQNHTITRVEINEKIKKEILTAEQSTGNKLTESEINNIQKVVNDNLKQKSITITETNNNVKSNLPTVQEVVTQEKNSATVSNANIPRLTSETSSGTSSIANSNTNNIKNQDNLNIKQYTDNDINRFLTGDNLIDGVNAKFNSFVEKYYDPITKKAKEHSVPTKTQKMFLGRISDSLAGKLNTLLNNSKMIQKQIGKKYDTTDTNIVISSNNIEHSYNDHGIEKRPGQMDVTPESLSKYGEVVSNPDYIGLSSQLSRGNTPTFYFTKKINGYSVAVEVLSTKKQLYPESYYVFKSDSKEYLDFIKNNRLKKAEDVVSNDIMSDDINARGDTTVAFSDNNIPQVDKNVKLPVISNNNTQNVEKNTNKILNPNEISQTNKEDANTTPILPNKEVSTGRGDSHFAKNIENKTDMLSKESKAEILDSNEVKYYREITNKGSLEKAFKRLNDGGKSETLNWFNKDSTKATDVDVAEGWILLKQYQDKVQNTTDLATKDELNRSMVQVAKKLREMGTKAGQTVQAYNILNRLTPEGMVYYAQSELSEAFEVMSKNKTKEWIDSNREQFNITPQETEFIMNTMQEVQQMEDGYDKKVKLAEIQSLMTDKLPPSKGSGIKAWMRISMLFNPKTQVRNVMGNAVIAPVNAFSDLFASVVDKQIAKKTGVRTTGTTDMKSYISGFSKGAYQSYNDFKKGINTRNIQGNRFEITEGKSFNDNTSIGKALNKVDSLLSFMLDAGDRTFYEATFTNSINNQLKLNNTTEVTQAMIDIATNESLSRTWQDNNGYTRFVLNIRKGLNAINIGGYGLGDVLIPFAKTPANLTKAIIDYSPAGMIKAINEGINLKRSLSNGQYNVQMQHQFVQDLGKATAGSMLYVLGIALAQAGITSGESDDDKDVSNFMKNTLGISSYSIKIGNKSFTYDWAQPIAAPLAITANIVQKQKDGATLYENIISSLDTAGNILLEQSFLESLNTVFSNNEGVATGIQEAVFELPSRAIPTLFKQIVDLIDPVQRTSFEYGKPLETAINKVKAKVPILSKTLAPSVDTMGREIQKYGGKNNIFNVFLNPANVNTENISKSAEEIYRLYKSTGDATIMPRVAPYYINQNGEKILLSSEQRADYQVISGNIIETSMKELLRKSAYKNLSDIEKADIINKIVGYSYNKAREDVLGIEMSNTYNKINRYIDDGGKVSNYYLNKEEIDYSYNNPEKYQVITQITTYDKYLNYQDEIDNVKTKYTNSTQRKNAVIKYVNSLNLSIAQKAMLIKLNYSSYNSYNDKIIQYINKQNLTKQEKTVILTKLGFTVRNGRVYS